MRRELEGRRLWFVGIGGDGMSALALVAAGLARRSPAPICARRASRRCSRRRLEVVIGEQRAENVPDGAEVVYSTAVPLDNVEVAAADRRLHRGELLAEIVACAPSIVVAGTHGKTTTAAMIAFCLQELGLDPAFVLGTEVPQLGGNASAGKAGS